MKENLPEITAYKIVSESKGKLMSYTVECPLDRHVEYVKGIPTVPKEGYGPLMAFGTIEDAREFYLTDSPIIHEEDQLWECKVRPLKMTSWDFFTKYDCRFVPPSKTLFCESITLIERIKL